MRRRVTSSSGHCSSSTSASVCPVSCEASAKGTGGRSKRSATDTSRTSASLRAVGGDTEAPVSTRATVTSPTPAAAASSRCVSPCDSRHSFVRASFKPNLLKVNQAANALQNKLPSGTCQPAITLLPSPRQGPSRDKRKSPRDLLAEVDRELCDRKAVVCPLT